MKNHTSKMDLDLTKDDWDSLVKFFELLIEADQENKKKDWADSDWLVLG